jgi:hypothetical protein
MFMQVWLKSIGVADNPIPHNWYVERPDALRRTQFSRSPSISVGDLLVYYAAGKKCVCAIMEVTSAPEMGNYPENWDAERRQRWPWSVAVAPRLVIPADAHAPSLIDIGVDSLSVRRQSHIKMSPEQFSKAANAILRIALRLPDRANIDMTI